MYSIINWIECYPVNGVIQRSNTVAWSITSSLFTFVIGAWPHSICSTVVKVLKQMESRGESFRNELLKMLAILEL